MANIAPANFAYVNANGDKGDVQVLSDADITLLNKGLQDIEDLKLAIQKPLPAGTIIPFAGTSTVPDNFLLCNGALVSRVTYSALYAAIGTAYGAGDGSTTFALPDYRDRVLQGASASHAAGTYIAAGLPNITGQTSKLAFRYAIEATMTMATGAFSDLNDEKESWTIGASDPIGSGEFHFTDFDASRSSSIYGVSSTVQPLAGAIQYLIKY